MCYDGEYQNGKRNGKVKEYNNNTGYLIFGDNYLNGKKWDGKEYDKNNKVIYKLKEGKGYVKELDFNGQIKFKGEYINGERNGTGKEFYIDGKLEFEGEYLNRKRWNRKEYDRENNIYEFKKGNGYIKNIMILTLIIWYLRVNI